MANDNLKKFTDLTRRQFMKCLTGTAGYMTFASFDLSGPLSLLLEQDIRKWPIDSTVVKTTERMITFSYVPPSGSGYPGPDPATSPNGGTALTWAELRQVSDYDDLGYGQWDYLDQPLPIVPRTDIMPVGYDAAAVAKKQSW